MAWPINEEPTEEETTSESTPQDGDATIAPMDVNEGGDECTDCKDEPSPSKSATDDPSTLPAETTSTSAAKKTVSKKADDLVLKKKPLKDKSDEEVIRTVQDHVAAREANDTAEVMVRKV